MYAKQVMFPYGKPGHIPTKRRPISTEVLMEVARIISHGIGPPRRFLVKGKTIIVRATRTLSIEFRRAITPVAMRGNNALPPSPIVINQWQLRVFLPDATTKKKRTLHFHDDYRLQRRKNIIRSDVY